MISVFSQQNTLKTHLLFHTGEKPLQCVMSVPNKSLLLAVSSHICVSILAKNPINAMSVPNNSQNLALCKHTCLYILKKNLTDVMSVPSNSHNNLIICKYTCVYILEKNPTNVMFVWSSSLRLTVSSHTFASTQEINHISAMSVPNSSDITTVFRDTRASMLGQNSHQSNEHWLVHRITDFNNLVRFVPVTHDL